mgnify:CR=1 FL=1
MTDALRTDFAPLMDIRRAAVVGASERGPGFTLLQNLSAHGGAVLGTVIGAIAVSVTALPRRTSPASPSGRRAASSIWPS